jgi:predicted RNA binding protein YcfA (HicA-like mRNA interferase family)
MITNSRELIKLVKGDGWYKVRTSGSHHHFRHPTKPGTLTIPHPKKDIPRGTVKSIYKQAQLEVE